MARASRCEQGRKDYELLLAQRVQAFRALKGYTQQELAEKLGLSQQIVSEMENKGEVKAGHLLRLRRLGLDLDQFLDDESGGTVQVRDPVLDALDLFQNLYGGGILNVHATRTESLEVFLSDMREERERIDIIGSSLKGFVTNRNFFDALTSSLKRNPGLNVRIIITHPAFGGIRALVEGRREQTIQEEILEAYNHYYDMLRREGGDRVAIKVALHPPTIFGIFLAEKRKAIINPYTLTIEAFSTASLIIRDPGSEGGRESSNDNMYRQYHKYHFVQAWDTRVTLTLAEFEADERKEEDSLSKLAAPFTKALGVLVNRSTENGLPSRPDPQ